MDPLHATYAFLTAVGIAAVLTPLSARIARRLGAVDIPRERGLSTQPTPRLGGLAILAATLIAGAVWLPGDGTTRGILGGAAVITLVGAVDDVRALNPGWKLAGQAVAALIPVLSGVRVETFTLPFVQHVDLGAFGGPLTLIGLVAVMNVVNLTDGLDGLASGVCTISGVAFAVIAFDLGKGDAGVLAALTAGASLGFLFHNFHPASVFMGDSGANLLGFLLGVAAVQGSVKTNAVIALVVPLVVLAVPFLDTGFVVAKRLKYRRPIYGADAWHFHHRFANIGFSQRRTVIYMYAWTLAMAGVAIALRFVPYSDNHGHFRLGGSIAMAALLLLALAASVYMVLVLEILKFRRIRSWQLRRLDPETSEHEIVETVERELETGEFRALGRPDPPGGGSSRPPTLRSRSDETASRGRPRHTRP